MRYAVSDSGWQVSRPSALAEVWQSDKMFMFTLRPHKLKFKPIQLLLKPCKIKCTAIGSKNAGASMWKK